MIYRVRQVSTCTYTEAVPFGRHVARLIPRVWPGQETLSAQLTTEPRASEVEQTLDFFGNPTRFFSIDQAHKRLTVTLDAEISVGEPPPPPQTPAWEKVRDSARSVSDLSAFSPAHYLFESRMIALGDDMGHFAAQFFSPGTPLLTGATALTRAIHQGFQYQPGFTDATTAPHEAFAARKGVCQDFAHIMIAGLRWLGLPAAYISGYLRTDPPPGKPRLEGADATHAWVQVWAGKDLGWMALDPTNGVAAGVDHLVLTMGRDYADVSPLDGVIVASGQQKIDVKVDVVPLRDDAKP